MESKYINKQVNFLLKHSTLEQTDKGVKLKNLMKMINRMHWRYIDEIITPNEIVTSLKKDKHFIVKGKYVMVKS